MKECWNNVVISTVALAMYVPADGGKSVHRERPFHGLVLNDEDAVKDYIFADGTVMHTEGGDLFFGLEEGCGGFTDYNDDLVPEEIQKECDELYEQLKSGEIKVFYGAITDNTGVVHGTDGQDLPYDEIRSMNWLVDFMAGTV